MEQIITSSTITAPTYVQDINSVNMFTPFQIISTIGIVSVLGAFIYIGRKLQILDTLQTTSEKTKSNLDVVCKYLMKNHTKFDPSELQTFSPLQLTEKGSTLINSIGFDNVFSKNQKHFFDFIDNEKPKLKYDVEISAIKSIFALYEESYMDFLKVYFYNNPNRSLEIQHLTLGVYIRDKYLEEHPEITQ